MLTCGGTGTLFLPVAIKIGILHKWLCYWLKQLSLKNLWNHGGGSYVSDGKHACLTVGRSVLSWDDVISIKKVSHQGQGGV